jgi:hypothetical protein
MDDADHRNGAPQPLAGALFYVLLGPIVWAFHLTLVYGGHTILCAPGASSDRALASGVVSLVIIATVAALAILIGAIVAAVFGQYRRNHRGSASMLFRDRAMIALALLSGVGVAWVGASALMVEPCQMLR